MNITVFIIAAVLLIAIATASAFRDPFRRLPLVDGYEEEDDYEKTEEEQEESSEDSEENAEDSVENAEDSVENAEDSVENAEDSEEENSGDEDSSEVKDSENEDSETKNSEIKAKEDSDTENEEVKADASEKDEKKSKTVLEKETIKSFDEAAVKIKEPAVNVNDVVDKVAAVEDTESPVILNSQFSILNSENLPRVSVIVTGKDCGDELRRCIPEIMKQRYAGGFDLIIAAACSDDDTEDVLEQLKAQYPEIYITFVPTKSRNMSIKKLMITLGVKASKNEWIILTDPTCVPVSEEWIATMATQCRDGIDLVMGYSNFDPEESKDFMRFKRLVNVCYCERAAQDGIAYRTACHNLAFRKSVFMEQRGFLHNLIAERGVYDYLVNEMAEEGNTEVVNSKKAWLIEQTPGKYEYQTEELHYMYTRTRLARSGKWRLRANTDTLLLVLTFLLCLIYIAGGVTCGLLSKPMEMALGHWILGGLAFITLIATVIVRTKTAKKAVRAFQAHIPAWKLYPFELREAHRRWRLLRKYHHHDEQEFWRKLN